MRDVRVVLPDVSSPAAMAEAGPTSVRKGSELTLDNSVSEKFTT